MAINHLLAVLSTVLAVVSGAAITPASPLNARAVQLCDQYGYTASENGYQLNNNMWGRDSASSGSQCLTYEGTITDGVRWSVNWNWQGAPNNVKSYPYAGRIMQPKRMTEISSLNSYFAWSYDHTEGVRANVAYDLFTSSNPNHPIGSGEYELMLWVGQFGGAFPISSSGSRVATVNIGGRTWDLYEGYNGSMFVYSFVVQNGPANQWGGNVKEFFDYLTRSRGFPAGNQYLLTFQAGTEPFTGGPVTFRVGDFDAAVV